MIKDRFKRDRFIEVMNGQNYPWFYIDAGEDEYEKNDSFFIYDDHGTARKGESPNQYLKEFTLAFISKSQKQIDEIKLALALEKAGLVFLRSDYDQGEIVETGIKATMVTLTFSHLLRVCDF